MARFQLSFASLGLAFLMGCAPLPPIRTPSGKPEITLHGVTRQKVLNGMMNWVLSAGYTVRSTSENQVVAGKPSDNVLDVVLYGTQFSGKPESRIIFTAVDVPGQDGDVRLVVTTQIVSNPGTAFEQIEDTSDSPMAHAIQSKLEGIPQARGRSISASELE